MITSIHRMLDLFQAKEVIAENIDSQIRLHVSIDSRLIRPGDTFVCLAGEKTNGHEFIPEAIQKGAIGVISNKRINLPSAYFQVITKSTEEALRISAKKILEESKLKQIAITGSAGKTTTKEILYSIFSPYMKTYKTIGNYNTPIGVPISLINMDEVNDYFICELSASYPGEIEQNLSYMSLKSGVITGIGSSHLEFFGKEENIFIEKMKIANYIQHLGFLLINGDQEWGLKAKKIYSNTLTFGFKDHNDIQILDLIRNRNGSEFKIRIDQAIYTGFQILAFGNHFIYDSVPGIFFALQENISITDIIQSLKMFRAEKGRGRLIRFIKNSTIIDESYNANPYSFAASLQSFSDSMYSRKIAIIGDMLELGPDSEKLHIELGKILYYSGISIILYKGQYKEAVRSGLSGSKIQFYAEDNLDLLENLFISLLENGDGILIKASNGVGLHKLVNQLEKYL